MQFHWVGSFILITSWWLAAHSAQPLTPDGPCLIQLLGDEAHCFLLKVNTAVGLVQVQSAAKPEFEQLVCAGVTQFNPSADFTKGRVQLFVQLLLAVSSVQPLLVSHVPVQLSEKSEVKQPGAIEAEQAVLAAFFLNPERQVLHV